MIKPKATVLVNGIKPNNSLFRSIERQVEKWIEREQSLLYLPNSCSYTVEFDCEVASHFFDCRLSVRVGTQEWQANEDGRTLPDALSRTIRHLRPIDSAAAPSWNERSVSA